MNETVEDLNARFNHVRLVPMDSCAKPSHNLMGRGLGKCRICHNADLYGHYTPKHRMEVPTCVGPPRAPRRHAW